jgi:hypothetical protein
VLVDYSSDEQSSHRRICMEEVEAEGNEDHDELLEKISGMRALPTPVMRTTLSTTPVD